MCRAYRSLVKIWHHDKHKGGETQQTRNNVYEAYKIFYEEEEKEQSGTETISPAPGKLNHGKSVKIHELITPGSKIKPSPSLEKVNVNQDNDGLVFKPTMLLKSLSKTHSKATRSATSSPTRLSRSQTQARSSSPPCFTRTTSKSGHVSPISSSSHKKEKRSKSAVRARPKSCSVSDMPSLSRTMSHKGSTPIVFSQSTTKKKPQAKKMKLECTMEELFHGSVKEISFSRDTLKNGFIVEEDNLLKIIVKPGWKKGTKITFEGKGDERPGFLPADITFIVDEIPHPLFKRIGDDLEYETEIPLVKALTGFNLSIPIFEGGKMSLSFEDVIYPGFEKVIKGQGMPISNEKDKRGDLRVKFNVKFPKKLTDTQRLEVSKILQDL